MRAMAVGATEQLTGHTVAASMGAKLKTPVYRGDVRARPGRRGGRTRSCEEPASSHPLWTNGRGWFRTSDLSRVKRALSH